MDLNLVIVLYNINHTHVGNSSGQPYRLLTRTRSTGIDYFHFYFLPPIPLRPLFMDVSLIMQDPISSSKIVALFNKGRKFQTFCHGAQNSATHKLRRLSSIERRQTPERRCGDDKKRSLLIIGLLAESWNCSHDCRSSGIRSILKACVLWVPSLIIHVEKKKYKMGNQMRSLEPYTDEEQTVEEIKRTA